MFYVFTTVLPQLLPREGQKERKEEKRKKGREDEKDSWKLYYRNVYSRGTQETLLGSLRQGIIKAGQLQEGEEHFRQIQQS